MDGHEWTFVLLDKDTRNAGWWLKIKSVPELLEYLELTNSKYAKAFENLEHDKAYRPELATHGPNPHETGLAMYAWLRGANRDMSAVRSLCSIASETAEDMLGMLSEHGTLYVNAVGGYNAHGRETPGAFCHRHTLAWPEFTEADIKISRFPGGTHWYARVGTVAVRDGDKAKFDTRTGAMAAAMAYLTGKD